MTPNPPDADDLPPTPTSGADVPGPPKPNRSSVSRRTFLGAAGGVAGAAAIGGGVWAALVRDRVDETTANRVVPATTVPTTSSAPVDSGLALPDDRVLVVVEMTGGNDALNTLVTGDPRYRDGRPQLAVAENEVIALSGVDFGLHPSLAALAPYWEDATLAAVAGVGMADQSRSHFKAMDTWWSGVPGASSQTGWLGRWLDATLQGENDPLRAISLGGGSRMLVGEKTLATVVRDPGTFRLRTLDGTDNAALVDAFLATAEPLAASPELAAAQYAIPATLDAVDLLASVTGTDDGALDYGAANGGNTFTSLLDAAAGIIDLGIGTQVITVGIGGFDTHANQPAAHASLLRDLGDGLDGFLRRVGEDGNADRVMVMTTTEFGRRVAENGSLGTDHGNGGCQFLLGPGVAGGQIVGAYDLDNLVRGDLPTVVDTRSVYSAALDWLGGPTDDLLDGPHERLGVLAA